MWIHSSGGAGTVRNNQIAWLLLLWQRQRHWRPPPRFGHCYCNKSLLCRLGHQGAGGGRLLRVCLMGGYERAWVPFARAWVPLRVRVGCVHVCVCACVRGSFRCMRVCVAGCVHAWVRACMGARMDAWMGASVYGCVHGWVRACVRACACVCACVRRSFCA